MNISLAAEVAKEAEHTAAESEAMIKLNASVDAVGSAAQILVFRLCFSRRHSVLIESFILLV
ncbi:hypothetical protein D3C81_2258690 [compost metagenome]